MKKFKVSIVILLFFMNAYTLSAKIIGDFGIKFGGNYSTIGNVNYRGWAESRIGFNCGSYIDFINIRYLNITLGINYSKISFGENWYLRTTPKTSLDFINIPVYIKLKYPDNPIQPYVFWGPSFNFLVNRYPGQFKNSGSKSPFTTRLNDKDITTIIGVGFTTSKIFKIPSFLEVMVDFSPRKTVGKDYTYKAVGWGVYLKEYQTYYYYSLKANLGIKFSEIFK